MGGDIDMPRDLGALMGLGQSAGQIGSAYGGSGYLYPYLPQPDKRTDREKLTERRESNNATIARLTAENAEVDEALRLLDEHPIIERMKNLIKKLVG